MFGVKVKIEKGLLKKAKRYSATAGYPSVEEFIQHLIEREISKTEQTDSEAELKKRMQGLGYLR
jgi:hypothetical protein